MNFNDTIHHETPVRRARWGYPALWGKSRFARSILIGTQIVWSLSLWDIPDVILDPTPLIQGCWSDWANRISRMEM